MPVNTLNRLGVNRDFHVTANLNVPGTTIGGRVLRRRCKRSVEQNLGRLVIDRVVSPLLEHLRVNAREALGFVPVSLEFIIAWDHVLESLSLIDVVQDILLVDDFRQDRAPLGVDLELSFDSTETLTDQTRSSLSTQWTRHWHCSVQLQNFGKCERESTLEALAVKRNVKFDSLWLAVWPAVPDWSFALDGVGVLL